jgi:hypothetical protein
MNKKLENQQANNGETYIPESGAEENGQEIRSETQELMGRRLGKQTKTHAASVKKIFTERVYTG